jgi:hypothetical protein
MQLNVPIGERPSRSNLVFAVGAEAPSHLTWAARAPSRTWDITLSYYGKPGSAPAANYDHVAPQGVGLKWTNIFNYFIQNTRLLDAYDYIWFPDDDIVGDPADIDRLFAYMREFDLDIGQPALTLDSYASHVITFQQPGYLMRRTNFVEVMMPCFKASYLKRVLPLFEGSYTGYGLDLGWAEQNMTQRAGIIDAIAMTHSREIGGGPIYEVMAKQGLGTVKEEESAARKRFGLAHHAKLPLGGILKDGRVVTGRWHALADLYFSQRRLRPEHLRPSQYKRRVNRDARRAAGKLVADSLAAWKGRGEGSPDGV